MYGCAYRGIAFLLGIPELKEPESFILDGKHASPLFPRGTLFLLNNKQTAVCRLYFPGLSALQTSLTI